MPALAYIFGNLFCVALLLILIGGMISEQESKEKNTFLALIFLAMLYIQCSTFWQLLGGSTLQHRIFCAVSRCLCAMLGYACFQYLYLMTTGRLCNTLAVMLPGILLGTLSIGSIWTQWLFRVDAANGYQPGEWYVVDRLLVTSYYIISAAVSLRLRRKSQSVFVRRRALAAASVVIPILVTEGVQLLEPGLELHGYGVVLAICCVFVLLQKYSVHESLQALRIQRENATRYRNTLLSNALQFLVVNLTKDTVMELSVPKNPEITMESMLLSGGLPSRRYSDTVRIWNRNIVGLTEAEKERMFLPEHLLRRFAAGETHITGLIRVVRKEKRFWCRQEVILTQNSQTGDVVATLTVYDITQQKIQDQAYETQQRVIQALASGVSAYWILDWETEQVLSHQTENERIRAFSDQILAQGTYTAALRYIFDTLVDENIRDELMDYVRVEEIRRRLSEADRYAPPVYLASQGFYFQMAYSLIYVGERKAFLVSAREITDTVQQERKLRQDLARALEDARSASHAKTIFLLNMSHDIRTPMNAILGFIELARRNIDDPNRVLDALEKSRRSGEHLLSLNHEIIDVGEHISRFVDMFRIPMEEKGLKLQVINETHTPYIYGDYLRITQVVANLLSNAMKFTPPGGSVTFRCAQLPEEQEGFARFALHVRDTGIGMDEEFQKRMFDAFERAENSTASGVQGTGLGLAISKRLAELMGGTLRCTSKPGQGTEFVFAFQGAVAPAPVRQEPSRTPDLQGKRILLVEDNELNREIAREILTQEGLEVTEAVNGAQGVEILQSARPGEFDAVLMDIQMPVMDGYQATREIRKLPNPELARIPIIAMTADAFAEDKRRALDAGMNEHISKPVNVKTLLNVLARYIAAPAGE